MTGGRAGRPVKAALALSAVIVGVGTDAPLDSSERFPSGESTQRPFAASSPFNTPIPPQARVDQVLTDVLRAPRRTAVLANLVAYGIPVHDTGEGARPVEVPCTLTGTWGPCSADDVVPLPWSARPNSGSDAVLVVVDRRSRKVHEFWRAERSPQGDWRTAWRSVSDLDGDGWASTATGAGASRLGGVVRVAEVEAGAVDHALVVQVDDACADRFVAPAVKTDGLSPAGECLPEGTRIRLDPAVDLRSMDLPRGARAVAVALQTYGAFVIDRGGAPLSMSFELDRTRTGTSPGSVYEAAGFTSDYAPLAGIRGEWLQVVTTGEN